ncbi:hypothetical protein AB0K93_17030 [Streptomyces sp. NPDC052676]
MPDLMKRRLDAGHGDEDTTGVIDLPPHIHPPPPLRAEFPA